MKNLKWLFLGGFVACFAFQLSAQKLNLTKPEIEWGEEFKRPSWSALKKVVATDETGFYVWRYKGFGNILLEHFDKKMNFTKGNEIELKYGEGNKEMNIEDFFHFDNRLYVLASHYDKSKDLNQLFVQKIDKQKLTLDGQDRLIASIAAKKSSNSGSFDYTFSRDSTKLLISNLMPYVRKDFERFAFRVFDASFNVVWEKEVTLPYEDKLFQVEHLEVDNEGNVYLLGKLYTDKVRDSRHGKPNYQYIVLSYRENGEKVKEYRVSLGEDFISEMTFRVANGDIICAGFYSEKGAYALKGSFYFKINSQTEEMYDIGKEAFSKEFLEKFMSEKKAKKGRELFNYDLDNLVLRSDGGAVLVAEQFYIRVVQYRDANGFVSQRRIYYYNDIIVVNINPDGSIAWANKIPKRQVDGSGYFSSYAMAIVRDKIYFIYNDHPKNLREKDPNRLKNFNGKKSAVTLATLSSNGEYDKEPLFLNRDQSIITRPKVCRQISKNQLLIFGEYKKRYKFGRVQF